MAARTAQEIWIDDKARSAGYADGAAFAQAHGLKNYRLQQTLSRRNQRAAARRCRRLGAAERIARDADRREVRVRFRRAGRDPELERQADHQRSLPFARRQRSRGGAHAAPQRTQYDLHLEPIGLRVRVRVLFDRPSRLYAPSHADRDLRSSALLRAPSCQVKIARSATSCSWAWANRSTITTT